MTEKERVEEAFTFLGRWESSPALQRLDLLRSHIEELDGRIAYLESIITQDGGVTYDLQRENIRLREALREITEVSFDFDQPFDLCQDIARQALSRSNQTCTC